MGSVLIALLALLFVGLVVLVPVGVYRQLRFDRVRKAVLSDWAAVQGWSFLESSRAPWTARLPGANRHGLGATLTGVLHGRWVTVADYSYSTTSSNGDTSSTTTHYFIVVLVLLDRIYPPISVRRAGLMMKLGRAVFGESQPPTGNVTFDSQFRIETADPACARALVGPALIDAHLAREVPLWSIVGAELLTYIPTSGTLQDRNMIAGYVMPLLHVADLLGR